MLTNTQEGGDKMKYDFSELLNNYRIKYELTQQEAAKRIGIF